MNGNCQNGLLVFMKNIKLFDLIVTDSYVLFEVLQVSITISSELSISLEANFFEK